jgi:hypothetical protein
MLLAAAAANPTHGDGAARAGAVLAVVAPDAGADGSLRTIVADAVEVQLLRRNAVASWADAEAGADWSPAQAISLAAARGAQYLLVCAYSTTERRISLRADVYDTAASARIGSGSAEGRVDLSLDEIVARALDTALAGITFTAPVAGEVAPPRPSAGSVPESPPGDAALDRRPGAEPALSLPARQRRVGMSAGAAPMIPTGPAADYTDIGLLATVTFELRFPARAGIFSAGILSGACLFRASGASSDAFVALVPLGIDAGWRVGSSGLGVSLHLSGGPALMATSAPAVSTLLKVVPYALAGMALEVPLSAAVGLAVQASYAVFFESASFPIMAVAPEVSLYARF